MLRSTDTSITEDADSERDARNARLDDIGEMRRKADAYTVQARITPDRRRSTALYDTLDDRQRHRSCNSFAKI